MGWNSDGEVEAEPLEGSTKTDFQLVKKVLEIKEFLQIIGIIGKMTSRVIF